MSRKYIFYVLAIVLSSLFVITAILHRLPHTSSLLYVEGIDRPEKHWEISQQPLTQVLHLSPTTIDSIGIKLVPYGGEPIGEITLQIINHNDQVLYQNSISSSDITHNTQFTYFKSLNLKHQEEEPLRLILSADHSGPTYIAAQVDKNPPGQEGSYLHREGILLQGFLALDVTKQEPLLKHLFSQLLTR